MEKTKKLPKPETLAKYEIKEDELREIMGPKGIIYKITSPSGKVYVGQTVRSFEKRMQEHKRMSVRTLINKAVNKYGDEMKYEIIEEDVPQEHLDEREIYWISHFNSLAPGGYNCTMGGQFKTEYSQKSKDNIRNGKNKMKIERDGYLGDVRQEGNLFYPRVRQHGKRVRVSIGGFQTKEEAIEVLKRYTQDPDNFTTFVNRNKSEFGSITKRGNRWQLTYKNKYIGSYETEEEARQALQSS